MPPVAPGHQDGKHLALAIPNMVIYPNLIFSVTV